MDGAKGPGAYGAHEFDTVLAAGERLRHDQRIVFVFIGGGRKQTSVCVASMSALEAKWAG